MNAANGQGATPLHFAANCGQASVVSYLLSKVTTAGGPLVASLPTPPSHAAARARSQGARPDAADRAGNTALHVAARVGFPAVIKALLAGGAAATVTNAAGKTPLEVALDADTAHALGGGAVGAVTA